jgi:hypothetical protein
MPRRRRRFLRRLYCILSLPPDHWITIGRCWRCGSPTAPPYEDQVRFTSIDRCPPGGLVGLVCAVLRPFGLRPAHSRFASKYGLDETMLTRLFRANELDPNSVFMSLELQKS